MLKKSLTILLAACLLAVMLVVPVGAVDIVDSGTCGENVTWSLSTDGTLTISGKGPMKDYSSPTSCPWEDLRNQITVAVIEHGVTAIGEWAFFNCDNLTNVTIPDGVVNIGDYAFSGCTGLASVTIPDSVTSIGDLAFERCRSLTSVKIPGGVTNIGDAAFASCISLTSVRVPTDNTAYCDVDGVLFNKNKTALLCYPAGRTAGTYAVPDGVTNIGDGAFESCTNLTNVTIPTSVIRLEDYAFSGCTSLTSVIIPDSVTSIKRGAFSNCTALTSATIGDGVDSITFDVFSDCTALISVAIGNGVVNIMKGTFSDCTALTNVRVSAGNTAYCDINGVLFDKNKTTLLCYPAGKTAETYVVQDGVINIGEASFFNSGNLISVTIPDSVTSIGGGAFYHCDSLTDVYYSDSAEQWSAIDIGSDNGPLISAVIHYNSTADAPTVAVTVNGAPVTWTDAAPFIDANSRTMVPLRAVADALGLSIDWNGTAREAVFTNGAKTIYFPIGSTSARTSDGKTVTMDTAAVIVNDRTYAPVRYLAEYFSHSVSWDGETQTVIIT